MLYYALKDPYNIGVINKQLIFPMTSKVPFVVSVRVNQESLKAFKQKCRENGLTQSSIIEGFINAWLSGEYVTCDRTGEEIREAFSNWAHDKGYEPSKVLDNLMKSLVEGKITLEDI